MTDPKQALADVMALLDVKTDGDYLARLANGQSIATQCCQFLRAEGRNLAHIPPDWQPTPEAINALPEPLRAYIHRIQTSHPSYDNAVRIRQLEEQVEQLQAALGEAERDAGRYRWLRAAENEDAVSGLITVYNYGEDPYLLDGNQLDAAIDAMAAGEDAK